MSLYHRLLCDHFFLNAWLSYPEINHCSCYTLTYGSKSDVKMWFKWTKYSDQTNFESSIVWTKSGSLNVFRIRFTSSKYLGLVAFLWPKYRNSLVMKIYKRHSHHLTVAWQTWLTQPGKFNLLTSSALKCKIGASIGSK